MTLVDSSAWIDFFRCQNLQHVTRLKSLIHQNEELAICGVIMTEILQGIRDENQYQMTKTRLDTLIFLPMTRTTYVTAANIYRTLRNKGLTIRKSIDCMIASVALENNVFLLHNDRDFEAIARHFPLKIIT
ncbi:PilT-like protein [Beggiatoa sp. PS]|nr:PilT-like protein [Beggiatoa sp. PS]